MSQLIRFYLEDKSKGESSTVVNDTSITFNYPCQSRTDCSPYHVIFHPGKYHIQLWGAQGGSDGNNKGGKGGYASGSINIYKKTTAYLYIGGTNDFSENDIVQIGGYNGGGNGFNNHTGKQFFGCAGGGATDLRLSEGNLYRRIIIAGGGGGCGKNTTNYAGCGGGEKGCDGHVELSSEVQEQEKCIIEGGNQTNGGRVSEHINISIDYNQSFWNYNVAHFGYGCSWHYTDGTGWSSGGGGGGYFGGACGCILGGGGAGGSGFVYSDKYPQHSIMSISLRYKMDGPMLEDGNSQYGNEGNGKATITILSEFADPFITCNEVNHRLLSLKTLIFIFFFSS